jgi:hypothetical protein
MALLTPIIFIVFNRPRHTIKTFESIRAQQPRHLLIIADGPRLNHPTDESNCAAVKEIISNIDWPCTVEHNFSSTNLGCKHRVISGLNWAFSRVDRAIILEDDCLPNYDFYSFCDILLDRFKDDERIMAIGGSNFQNGIIRGDGSYYYSKYSHIWGWATWRRAWEKNDPALKFWPSWKKSEAWAAQTPNKIERQYWSKIFDRMYKNEIDTWDYPWTANIWYHGGLNIIPNKNLVSNIGFGPDGTHTIASKDQQGQATQSLGELVHPSLIVQDMIADQYTYDHLLGGLNQKWPWWLIRLPCRILRKLKQYF